MAPAGAVGARPAHQRVWALPDLKLLRELAGASARTWSKDGRHHLLQHVPEALEATMTAFTQSNVRNRVQRCRVLHAR